MRHAQVVCGSRGYGRLDVVRAFVDTLPPDSVLIVGGAHGPDMAAELRGLARGLDVRVFRPDWERFGRGAGYRRNADMLTALLLLRGYRRHVAAFWDGSSRGTDWMIREARKRGIDLDCWGPDGHPWVFEWQL